MLRRLTFDMLDENPERTPELDQVNAMTREIHAWLAETEGQNWAWDGKSANAARLSIPL